MVKVLRNADIAPKRFEINQLFTPSTPVTVAELFAGRLDQMMRITDTIAETGRHAIVYGERGVGKTSLMQIVPFMVPNKVGRVRFCRVQAYPDSTFHSLFNAVFKKILFTAEIGHGEQVQRRRYIHGRDYTGRRGDRV
jgi:Cdc6-like AAA superfamily ATPase